MSKPWFNFRFASRESNEPTIKRSTLTKKLQPLLLEQNGGFIEVVDTRNYVFLIFMVFGFGALLPWNMFINISHDYYAMFKLRDSNSSATWFSNNFQNSMTISAQLPNLIFSVANIFFAAKGDLTRRMRVCLALVQAMVLITIFCIYIETSSWTAIFFILTILTIIVLNAANGLFQNSLFGLASPFPFKYTNAILIGQNFCGIAVTVLSMLTRAVSDDIQIRAALYFGLSSVVIVVCFFLLKVIKKFPFYERYDSSDDTIDEDSDLGDTIWQDIGIAFSKSKMQFANIFLLFFVTLSMFPSICMHVTDERPGEEYNFIVPKNYYMDVTTFLNFNLFAFLGSLTANWIRVPGPKSIWIAVVVRFWFVFYFPAANYHPALTTVRSLPVLFESTWFFVLNVTALAFSSGYLSSLIMMYAPRSHEDPKIQRVAGMIAAFFLIAGVVAGLVFSWIIKLFVLSFD